MSVGIIAEYNPFHNGHLYHLNKIKELYPNETIILVTNSYFSQRGDFIILDKWDKTKICLELGIDLIVELPFVFASQGADIFARGSIEILNYLKVDKVIFGSESNDVNFLKEIALINQNDPLIKKYLDKGYSYPRSLAEFLSSKYNITLNTPNDILGVCYIREIIRLNSPIKYMSIKRTNDYHSQKLEKISSATSIRKALSNNEDISESMPEIVKNYLRPHYLDEYFELLKYKILFDKDLAIYKTVDEGIEYRLKKYILISDSFEEFLSKVKTKRYTHNRLKRMCVHILCGFTKEEANNIKTEYIRILGFNKKGQSYLQKIKKEIEIPLLTKYQKSHNLDIEIRSAGLYSYLAKNKYILKEYKNKPIIKKD